MRSPCTELAGQHERGARLVGGQGHVPLATLVGGRGQDRLQHLGRVLDLRLRYSLAPPSAPLAQSCPKARSKPACQRAGPHPERTAPLL